MLAQLGAPDMRIPIAHTLAWPERMATPCRAARPGRGSARSTSRRPISSAFPALRLARAGARSGGGAAPIVLNAANEVAVAAFLDGRIGFLDIAASVERGAATRSTPPAPALDRRGLDIDREARDMADELISELAA